MKFKALVKCLILSVTLICSSIMAADRQAFEEELEVVRPAIIALALAPHPDIFVSYSYDSDQHQATVEQLCKDLVRAGVPVDKILFDQWVNQPGGGYDLFQYIDKVPTSEKVILVGSEQLQQKYDDRRGMVSQEINLLRQRILKKGVTGVIPVWFEGRNDEVFPNSIQLVPGRNLSNYHSNFFRLLENIYQDTHMFTPGDNVFTQAAARF